MNLIDISVLILSVNVLTTCALNGEATFNNTATGLNGTVTVRQNAVLGTYLYGQIRNINCLNSTSATKNKAEAAQLNNCMVGLSINNWANNNTTDKSLNTTNTTFLSESMVLERNGRQQQQPIFDMSNIKLPDIREILGIFRPNQTTTSTPSFPNGLGMGYGDTCANVGDIYNPRGDWINNILGFLRPPGVIGNMVVNNGTGSLLMGPLELMTAGRTSVMGLPLVLWMDSIRPILNGSTITLNRGSNDRILDCAIINPTP